MLLIGFVVLGLATIINGHGYMQDPPARNSMWRFGFNNPPNYNDNQQYCGGKDVMKGLGGKCGVCGDRYGSPNPRHADGGIYANGIIVKTYKKEQIIDIKVLLTASHKGTFEFRVGDFSNSKTEGDSIGKLKGQLMELVSGGTQFKVLKYGKQLLDVHLKLPSNLTCKRCVIQWWYRGGNSWGCGQTGCGLGKGTQEHFVNCADVSIE